MNFTDLKEPYLIGEIGINHNSDIEIIKKLLSAVYCCGWNCAKFQTRNPNLIPDNQKDKARQTPWGEMTYLEYKKRMELTYKDYLEIRDICKEFSIDWSTSIWDLDSLKTMEYFNKDIPFLKIPSAKITDLELVSECAKSRKSIVISTGMSTLEEVDACFNVLMKEPKLSLCNIAVLHCNAAYPCPKEDINLKMISALKGRYGCTIGYSGHELDLASSVFAVREGAMIVEKHITLDHSMWGTDQKSSLEISGMNILKKRISELPLIYGDGIKKVTKLELDKRMSLRGY